MIQKEVKNSKVNEKSRQPSSHLIFAKVSVDCHINSDYSHTNLYKLRTNR